MKAIVIATTFGRWTSPARAAVLAGPILELAPFAVAVVTLR